MGQGIRNGTEEKHVKLQYITEMVSEGDSKKGWAAIG